MQLIAHVSGGRVEHGTREYGRARLHLRSNESRLFAGMDPDTGIQVWCSHGDHVDEPPPGFTTTASTNTLPVAAFESNERRVYGVQFHPEVAHTPQGGALIANFLFEIAGCEATWTSAAFIESHVAAIRKQVGDAQVICGLSGGVDSSVAAALVHRAIGDQLTCVFVDHGLLRQNERHEVETTYRESTGVRLIVEDASDLFLANLAGVVDPERKRKIIGETFIRVFEAVCDREVHEAEYLVQGTLYPDVIESFSVRGPSATIKTHHNVGGLPDDMRFDLIEPLRELFKDEVREVGRELGVPEVFVGRHPFPGPGLAIRVLGDVTRDRLAILREADAIYLDEIRQAGLYDDIWQAFAVLLPVQTVGVMGDERTYESVIALRAVTSKDGMTADWFGFPHDVLSQMSTRIINSVRGVNRVCYDISSKPPATIEWE